MWAGDYATLTKSPAGTLHVKYAPLRDIPQNVSHLLFRLTLDCRAAVIGIVPLLVATQHVGHLLFGIIVRWKNWIRNFNHCGLLSYLQFHFKRSPTGNQQYISQFPAALALFLVQNSSSLSGVALSGGASAAISARSSG